MLYVNTLLNELALDQYHLTKQQPSLSTVLDTSSLAWPLSPKHVLGNHPICQCVARKCSIWFIRSKLVLE